MAMGNMSAEQLLKEMELRDVIFRNQMARMEKELAQKDEEIRKLQMQLDERTFVLDSVLARITLKE